MILCRIVYMCTKKVVIERNRDLIYLKFVFFLAPVQEKTPVIQCSPSLATPYPFDLPEEGVNLVNLFSSRFESGVYCVNVGMCTG